MENIRVRRAGYAFRQIYEQFLYRYKCWPLKHGRHGMVLRKMESNIYYKLKMFLRKNMLLEKQRYLYKIQNWYVRIDFKKHTSN